jgi:hypothetical protein
LEVIVKTIAKLSLAAPWLFAFAVSAGSAAPANASALSAASTEAFVQDAAQGSSASTASGTRQVSWTGRDGKPKQGSMQIKQDGASLKGSFQAPRGTGKLSGTLQGNQISLAIKAGRQEVTWSGTVNGDKMSGTTGQGSSWSAIRQ